MLGTVDFFDRHTGRGQILGDDDHRAYWTHRRELPPGTTLQTGERVAFTPRETPRGPRALEVRPCEGAITR